MRKIIIILGRSQNLSFNLNNKLSISYLDFFKNLPNKNLKFYLKSYLRRPIHTNEISVHEIFKNNLNSIYFVEAFTYDPKLKIEVFACIIKTLIRLNSYDSGKDKIVYLCHDTHFGKDSLTEESVIDNEKLKIIDRLYELLNIKISNKKLFIATFFHESKSIIFSSLKNAAKKNWNNINLVAFFNSFDKNIFLDPPKKLIDTFLPLAIDAQGIKEVAKEKKEKYLDEIIKNVKENADTIAKSWNEIRMICKDFSIDFNNNNRIEKSNNSFINIRCCPLEDKELSKINKKSLIKYFKNYDTWNDEEYLPNWLNTAINILNTQINKNNKAK
jgi:hypothetical protein